MSQLLDSIFSFFVPLFIVLLHYWYISLPVIGLIIVSYLKVKNEDVKRFLRILLAFILLSVIFTLIYILITE